MATIITLMRIALIAPFAALFFWPADWAMTAALIVFAVAALSDFLDGYVARARNEVSKLGAALDPVADKALVLASLLLLASSGLISGLGVAGALAIIMREVLIGGLREAIAADGADLPVTALSKSKTAIQLIAIGALIAAAPGGLIGPSAQAIAHGLFVFAVVLTVWTGAQHLVAAIGHLHGGRAISQDELAQEEPAS